MSRLDRILERAARGMARRISRRSLFARMGAATVIGLPALPVARGLAAEKRPRPPQPQEHGNQQTCDYWRYCAIDGFLCSCCGGSVSTCPPGTEPSAITWVGTCRNPLDSRDYVISYNDCCGKSACGRCECNRNEGDTPIYDPATSNDLDWCLGAQVGVIYNCSTAVVQGPA